MDEFVPKHASMIGSRNGILTERCPFCEAGYNPKNEMCIPVLNKEGTVISLKLNPKSARAIKARLEEKAKQRQALIAKYKAIAKRVKDYILIKLRLKKDNSNPSTN